MAEPGRQHDSKETAREIDRTSHELINTAFDTAVRFLTLHKVEVHEEAELLLAKEILLRDALRTLRAPVPVPALTHA